MKQAAAKAKAQRAEVKGRPAAANKIAASPRVPGTRDPRLALPKSLTKKGWDYSKYMNRDDAESDRRYFARQWTASKKKEIAIRNEIASLKKKDRETKGKIAATKAKMKKGDSGASKVAAVGQARLKEANKRLAAANDKVASISANLAQRKADFQKRFGMSYEESLARRATAKKRKR